MATQQQMVVPVLQASNTIVPSMQTTASSDTFTDENTVETTPPDLARQSSSDIEGADTSQCPVVGATWTSDLSPTSPAEPAAHQEDVTSQPLPQAEQLAKR